MTERLHAEREEYVGPQSLKDLIAVELLCSLLTGFFLWLLIYQWRRKSLARTDRLAGSLLCRAGSIRLSPARWVLFIWFFIVVLWNVLVIIFGPQFRHT